MKKLGLIFSVLFLSIGLAIANILVTGISNPPPAFAQTSIAQKVCSGYVVSNFRDTISVPSGWSAGSCQSWAKDIGATEYQLGCVFNKSYSWGIPGGGTPSPNCGW